MARLVTKKPTKSTFHFVFALGAFKLCFLSHSKRNRNHFNFSIVFHFMNYKRSGIIFNEGNGDTKVYENPEIGQQFQPMFINYKHDHYKL